MRFLLLAGAVTSALVLAGCAGLPRERGYAQADALVAERLPSSPDWSLQLGDAAPELEQPTRPVDLDDARRLAFHNSPRVRRAYAALGVDRADFEAARRLANPRIGYGRLEADGGGPAQIMRSISVGLGDLLFLPTRSRLAGAEFERAQLAAADALLQLATDAEQAWYRAVAAAQVQAMRDVVATAAEQSAALAQRFFDAGNINRLQLERERAAATQARIAAVRAQAEALQARATLADLLGLRTGDAWTLATQLPAPDATTFDAAALTTLALDQRLDLAAARHAVAQREDALGVTRRWRWLGDVELGYERETESDGQVKRGPSLSLALPLFDQGQSAVTRADAGLRDARAALDAAVLDTHNTVASRVDRVALARDIAARYRDALVPQREAIVARTQEHVNYMLRGVFELIEAKQDEYDAYADYLDAVRDYWLARSELRHAVGGRLPDDGARREATLGVEAILPKEPTSAPEDHSHHHMHGHAPPQDAPPTKDAAGHVHDATDDTTQDERDTETHDHHQHHGDHR